MALALPVLLALFVNLAFGNIFSDRPKLGVYDAGNSRLVAVLESAGSVRLRLYDGDAGLRAAVSSGAVDMGVVLPADFDATLSGGTARLKAYIWGESLARNRAIIPAVLADSVHQVAGSPAPVTVETIALGDESSLPWSDRLMPAVVLLAVFFGGMMLPASSLINEKQRHTLEALNVTPASVGEIFLAKGVIGAVLATFMGALTLVLSGNFIGPALLLVLVLALGAVMAAEIGLLAGAFIKDMNTLYAFWKFGGLLLFGPAVVFLFPQIPRWVAYIFPTYYVVRPVMDLSVSGLGPGDVWPSRVILAALVVLGGMVVASVVRRLSAQALRLAG
jgi:ABC-2 type transport system permease protein